MFCIHVEIIRFVDESFPGWVEFRLVDALGQSHTFRDKVPMVTEEVLWDDSVYPCAGSVACEVVRRWQDQGRALCEISTASPWSIESKEGRTNFVVLASQVAEPPKSWQKSPNEIR
jgi:hypothetical protein